MATTFEAESPVGDGRAVRSKISLACDTCRRRKYIASQKLPSQVPELRRCRYISDIFLVLQVPMRRQETDLHTLLQCQTRLYLPDAGERARKVSPIRPFVLSSFRNDRCNAPVISQILEVEIVARPITASHHSI